MHYLTGTFVAAFAGATYASPVRPVIGFTVSTALTLSPRSQNINPALAIANTHYKYTGTLTPLVKAAYVTQSQKIKAAAAAAKKTTSQTGSVTATPEPFDVEYLVPVAVGNQTFNLVLDSGSADLWVYSDKLSTTAQAGHTIYATNSSNQIAGQTFSVSYGDGSYARGLVYADTVSIGGATATTQAVEAATDISTSFLNHVDADGLLGVAFTSLNSVSPTQQSTFFDNVKASLASPLWAVSLKKQSVGSLDFGFINKTKYTGSLNYMPVSPTGASFWQFPIRRWAINGTEGTMTPFNVIVDTGTSLTYLPDTIVNKYYAKVSGAAVDSHWGGWTFPCATQNPPMGIFMNGIKYTMPAAVLNWEQINSTHCLGGLQSSAALPFSILGDVFLKTVYVVFDQTTSVPRLGFGHANPLA